MKRVSVVALASAMLLAANARSAYAGAVMQINNSTAFLFSQEVHPVSTPSITITENGGGQPQLANPLLLIVGVPNLTNYVVPPLALSTGTADPGGTGPGGQFGGSYNNASGLASNNDGKFVSGEVYSFLGLSSGNNSNNFGNWHDADLAVTGVNASFFGIFVYELSNTGIKGGTTITATFSKQLPLGTFVIAYGMANGEAFTTPFTQSGTSTKDPPPPVPEPASLVLLGTGISVLAARYRRRS